MTTQTEKRPTCELVIADDGSWNSTAKIDPVTPPKEDSREPAPQTWFEDRRTRELFYYLGKDTTPGIGGHVFQTNGDFSQRIMSLDMVRLKLRQVYPARPNYPFASVRDMDLYRRYAQPAKADDRVDDGDALYNRFPDHAQSLPSSKEPKRVNTGEADDCTGWL